LNHSSAREHPAHSLKESQPIPVHYKQALAEEFLQLMYVSNPEQRKKQPVGFSRQRQPSKQ